MSIQGVIFDLGWTLMYNDGKFKENEWHAITRLVEFLRANGIHVGDDFPDRFHAARERGWKRAEESGIEQPGALALAETLAQMGYPQLDGLVPRANDVFFAELGRQWRAYPDALSTLQALTQRRLRVGIVSNADDVGLVVNEVANLGFAPYVDPVLSSSAEPRWRKPDPRIFHLVSTAWHIAPANIAFVGDSPRFDTLGAHRAGMRAILVDHAEGYWWQKIPDELANDPAIHPDATVRSLAEIPAALDKL
jgi:HAD superfamily hydrolase (TIGR01509 family)